ncbi:MAG TPA: hypothetical protein IAA52_08425 [Candidatus Pullichristensenella stercorigallinarum]|uniref:Serine/threonine-protein kinase RsbW n=1 Tax=Candidatus Pullichristensenella stercorigallinarum TaxID=2840909 RepID=A0A9D0ZPK4_9FIRM|nr:hypothetical protein [Candidatus Pullichristensenella stercorigallinarum]
MREVLPEGAISLTVPADKSMMLVIRLTTAGVLARARLTVDAIDDMKMAVEEACTLMISQQCPPGALCVEFFRKDAGLEIHVHSVAEHPCLCGMDPAELEVVRAILCSLADAAEIDYQDGKIRNILLTKELRP